jgi:UDP-glucose 4-epimerase
MKAYNLGTGQGHTVLEMIRTFAEVSGREVCTMSSFP